MLDGQKDTYTDGQTKQTWYTDSEQLMEGIFRTDFTRKLYLSPDSCSATYAYMELFRLSVLGKYKSWLTEWNWRRKEDLALSQLRCGKSVAGIQVAYIHYNRSKFLGGTGNNWANSGQIRSGDVRVTTCRKNDHWVFQLYMNPTISTKKNLQMYREIILHSFPLTGFSLRQKWKVIY